MKISGIIPSQWLSCTPNTPAREHRRLEEEAEVLEHKSSRPPVYFVKLLSLLGFVDAGKPKMLGPFFLVPDFMISARPPTSGQLILHGIQNVSPSQVFHSILRASDFETVSPLQMDARTWAGPPILTPAP
jgi:hypothetical protein